MGKNKILYWPGRGQNLDILRHFREELNILGYEFENINIIYDKGTLNPSNWKQVVENNADWWIGISLGASLLYYSMQFTEKNRPNRITLINPFSSRDVLSKERNFNLKNQWNFAPINYKGKVDCLDVVLSTNDTKIPMYHGVKLLNNTISSKKQVIFIDENHTIDDKNAQIELARVLKYSNILERGFYYEGYKYCNIYKQK